MTRHYAAPLSSEVELLCTLSRNMIHSRLSFISMFYSVDGSDGLFKCDLILTCLSGGFAAKELMASDSTTIYYKVYEKGKNI